MRRVLCFSLSILLITSLFAQQTTAGPTLTKEDYLKKSKNQKTAAWILLGTGAALIGMGLATGNGDESSFDEAESGAIIGIVGAAAIITSIPLFIASGRNKRKAEAATTYLDLRRENFMTGALHSFPAIGLKLAF